MEFILNFTDVDFLPSIGTDRPCPQALEEESQTGPDATALADDLPQPDFTQVPSEASHSAQGCLFFGSTVPNGIFSGVRVI